MKTRKISPSEKNSRGKEKKKKPLSISPYEIKPVTYVALTKPK
jgi:hypothetical protein